MTLTAGRQPNVIPTNSASGLSEFFKAELGIPVMWGAHSYGGCGQHGRMSTASAHCFVMVSD